jgi:uncharacterized repeat protein (TIGR01451 family)
MTVHNQPNRSLLAVLGVALGVTVAALAAPTALAAGGTSAATQGLPSSAPQLSIAVDNGHTTATAGDTLTYTISVQNLGTAGVAHLHVTQSMPAGLKFKSADSAGKATAGSVSWTLDLKTAGETKVHSTMTVLDTPPELLRMATVACASTSADDPPIVCAAHSDQLPAGVSAAAAARESTAPGSDGIDPRLLSLGIAAAALVVAALVVVLVRRRRTPRAAHTGGHR